MNIPPSQWCSIFVLVRVEIREDAGNLRMLISRVSLRPWRKIKVLLRINSVSFCKVNFWKGKLLQIRLNFLASKFTWDEISFNLFNDSCLNFVYLILLIETGRNLIDTHYNFSPAIICFLRGEFDRNGTLTLYLTRVIYFPIFFPLCERSKWKRIFAGIQDSMSEYYNVGIFHSTHAIPSLIVPSALWEYRIVKEVVTRIPRRFIVCHRTGYFG